jgi:hypothetical protein
MAGGVANHHERKRDLDEKLLPKNQPSVPNKSQFFQPLVYGVSGAVLTGEPDCFDF